MRRQPKRWFQRIGSKNEGRQHVQEVLVGDPEAPVQGIHARDGPRTARTVKTVLDDFTDDQVGVVVTLAGARFELASSVQHAADPR
jgi:hypothetical protein